MLLEVHYGSHSLSLSLLTALVVLWAPSAQAQSCGEHDFDFNEIMFARTDADYPLGDCFDANGIAYAKHVN